jgi:hypothetical protein
LIAAEGVIALQDAWRGAYFVSTKSPGWPIRRVLCDEWGTEGDRGGELRVVVWTAEVPHSCRKVRGLNRPPRLEWSVMSGPPARAPAIRGIIG